MNRSATRLYGWALLAGLPLALLAASSCVAFHYGFDPALGRPVWWRIYDPFSAPLVGLVLGPDAHLPRRLPLRPLARRGRLAPAGGRPPRLREMREPLAGGGRPGGLAPRHRGTPQGARRLRSTAGRASSSGSTASGPSTRPATCTGSSSARRGPARASTTSCRRSFTWTKSALVLDFKGELASVCGPDEHSTSARCSRSTPRARARHASTPCSRSGPGPEIVHRRPGARPHGWSNPDLHVSSRRHGLERRRRRSSPPPSWSPRASRGTLDARALPRAAVTTSCRPARAELAAPWAVRR